jgi:uncharacterized integral membrane protein
LEKLTEKINNPGESSLIRGLILVFLIFIGATFATVNREEVRIRFFFDWETGPIPFFLFIFIALGAGWVVGSLFGWGERRKLRNKGRELSDRIESLKEEVEALRKETQPPPAPALNPADAGKSPPA